MTDEELAAIEAHAQAVDNPMNENCLRLIECLGACRTAKGLLARRLEVAITERDEARQKAADWEQTARELTARMKP
jgi:hypothetical protein